MSDGPPVGAHETVPSSAIDAFRLAATGTREDLTRAAVAAPRPQSALLKAVEAQYAGDVAKALRLLRRQMQTTTGADRAVAADFLAPLLVMHHASAEVRVLANILDGEGWTASAEAFRALAATSDGDRESARRHAEKSARALENESDDVIRLRVLMRLSRAAFYLHDYEDALRMALESAHICVSLGAWRAAGGGWSVAYSIQHDVLGNVVEAAAYARRWLEAAERAQDESTVQSALVAEYELAVQMADDERMDSLHRRLEARGLPPQYAERFGHAFSQALHRGRSDLDAMRAMLQVLGTATDLSDGDWALCAAFIALADVARGDLDPARHGARAVLSRLGRPRVRNAAYEIRHRRLARAVAAAVFRLVGDEVRAIRIVGARESRDGSGEQRLPQQMMTRSLDQAPLALRGAARVLAHAHAVVSADVPPAGLTPTELGLLRLYATGRSAGTIAAETSRSRHTVYKHTQAILAKLNAGRAPEAVAIARRMGIID